MTNKTFVMFHLNTGNNKAIIDQCEMINVPRLHERVIIKGKHHIVVDISWIPENQSPTHIESVVVFVHEMREDD